MTTNRGFTLIEALITAGIVACGLVAVASVFAFAVRANIGNRQLSAATTLLYNKMEEFRAAPVTNPIWAAGDGSEEITLDGRYVLAWQVRGTALRSVTVIVYAADGRRELIRATTLAGPVFR